MTFINNLASILARGGLLSFWKMRQEGIQYTNIAYNELQNKRDLVSIPISPGEKLHDYIPFYFAPRSPMLNALNNGRVINFKGGQETIIFLITSVNVIAQSECQFVFTDGHPGNGRCGFFNQLKDLNQIDWAVIRSPFWDGQERAHKRQAEFLVHSFLPFQFIQEVAVINNLYKSAVEQIMQEAGWKTPVVVQRLYYH